MIISEYSQSQAKISILILIKGSTHEQKDIIETCWDESHDVQHWKGTAYQKETDVIALPFQEGATHCMGIQSWE